MEWTISNKMKSVTGSKIRESLKLAGDPSIIAFGGGNPSTDSFPLEDIRRIAAEALLENPNLMLKYGVSEGYTPLRETLKVFLTKKFGFDFDKNEIMIVSGGQQVADLTTKALVNEGDVVISENPSFSGGLNAFRTYGPKMVGVPVESDGMNIEKLEEALKTNENVRFIYIISSFQNPTGFTTSKEKREQIYKLAQKYNVAILEDNPYGELRFEGEDVAPIKSMDVDGRVIYAGSFSKVMAPAFRIGFMVFDKGLMDKMVVGKQCTDVHSNMLFQYICNEFMTKCDYDAHILRIKEIYRTKCNLMLSEMEKKFHPDVTFHRPQGGLFVMAFLPEGMDASPFQKEAIVRKVACIAGDSFTVDPDEISNGFRMNYSASSDEDIVKGVDILGKLTHEWIENHKK